MSLAICAVARNEAPYIEDFVDFHIRQGVTFFLFYENQSTDDTLQVLQRLQLKHLTEHIIINIQTIDENPCQFIAYNRGLALLKSIPDVLNPPVWCSFLDCDEALYSPTGKKLPVVLEWFKNASQVAPHWVLYGSNGLTEYDSRPVTERFTMRSREVNQHTKAVVRVKDGIEVGRNPHYFLVTGSTQDENGNVLKDWRGLKTGGTADILRVNHYHVKSKAEYFERKKKPDPGTGAIYSKERLEEMFRAHDCNELEDRSACA
jgi:hypothetical protein